MSHEPRKKFLHNPRGVSLSTNRQYLTKSNNIKQYTLKSSLHKVRPENKWITYVRGAPSSGGYKKQYELLLLQDFPASDMFSLTPLLYGNS